ncbi:MAG TPA: hypothetical protein VNL15_06070 [Dehalococcoidia bacterium]|nr:hypothetical protein [Dehalococcoidia bacterium]
MQTDFYFPLIAWGDAEGDYTTAATFAAGDVKISKDGGAQANTTNLPSHIGSGVYKLTLTATEMQAAKIFVTLIDAATKVWADQTILIATYGNASAEHAVDLDDSVRAGLTALPNAAAEAAGGLITRGTGAGQVNQDANGRIDVNIAAISADAVAADNLEAEYDGTGYKDYVRRGTAQAGAAGTITLDAAASASDDLYNGLIVAIVSGTGIGQARLVTDYVGATKVATVSPNWITAPDATSVFVLLPWARVDLEFWRGITPNPLVSGLLQAQANQLGTQGKADVNAEVLDVLNVDTFAEPGQEAPPATTTLVKKIGYLYKVLRNKITQDNTTLKIFADDGTTVDQKAAISDDGTTYTRGEIGTGP